jgi:hypothetical protein
VTEKVSAGLFGDAASASFEPMPKRLFKVNPIAVTPPVISSLRRLDSPGCSIIVGSMLVRGWFMTE